MMKAVWVLSWWIISFEGMTSGTQEYRTEKKCKQGANDWIIRKNIRTVRAVRAWCNKK